MLVIGQITSPLITAIGIIIERAHLKIEVRCMSGGEILKEMHLAESETLLLQDIGIPLSGD
jgi:hypothetical protein